MKPLDQLNLRQEYKSVKIKRTLVEEIAMESPDYPYQEVLKPYERMKNRAGFNSKGRPIGLLLYGEPESGKTTLIRKLMEYCPIYGFPRDEWFHGYKSFIFLGILWNEMTLTGIDVEMLKNFLEGMPVKLNVKGSQVQKDDNPEVFITANFSLKDMIEEKCRNLSDMRKEKIMLNALRERIEEVNVDQYENIFFLSKLIVPVGKE